MATRTRKTTQAEPKQHAKPGPKGKYSTDSVQPFLDAVEQGTPYRHACAIAGFSEASLRRWREEHDEFDAAIKAAEGRAVASRLARIRVAANTHWQADAWWLERKYPHEFGRTVQDINKSFTLDRTQAQELADRLGLDVDEIIAEAERYIADLQKQKT
jgi:hypothetical protein